MTIQEKLYEKLSAEHQARIEEIKQLPPDKIIERAYEIYIKDDLLSYFYTPNIGDDEASVLLKLDRPLDHLYYEWLDVDTSHMDALQDCINEEIDKLLDEEWEQPAEEKEVVAGYEIIKRVEVGQKAFVIGHNPKAVQPYVTWVGRKDRTGGYDWGHYTASREAAEAKMQIRINSEQQCIDRPRNNRGGAR